jgi:RHS repeat-associated protein
VKEVADVYRGKDTISKVNARQIIWDVENRIESISADGFVSSFIYDGNGERAVKMSTSNSGVFIDATLSPNTKRTAPASFSLYVNPYYCMRNGNGMYTKYIYIGTQRIASEVFSEATSNYPPGAGPAAVAKRVVVLGGSFYRRYVQDTYPQQQTQINNRFNAHYDSFSLPHAVIDPTAFNRLPNASYPESANPFENRVRPVNIESQVALNNVLRYYYHGNLVGSTQFVTRVVGASAEIAHLAEYMPYGELFMEQRRNFSSPYLYNGKEQDNETGLYDYGARYYDPHTYQWLGIDPMVEKYPGMSPYTYCLNNPITLMDPDGRIPGSMMTRLGGGLRMLGGISEASLGVTGGVATSWTGFGGVIGALAVMHGTDQIATGFMELMTGESRPSLTESSMLAAGVSPQTASVIDMSLGITLSGGAGFASNTARNLPALTASEAAASNAATQYTKSNMQLGQQMHKMYKAGDVIEGVAMKEFRGISGIRPDFVDFSTKTIYELKPFNPRSMSEGIKQLEKYKEAFEGTYGGTWKIILDTY